MSEDWTPDEVFAVLDDEYARAILTATSLEPMSANDISDTCDMSRSTVSRRVNTLLEHEFLAESTQLDPEDGNHYSVYEARLDRIDVELRDGEFDVEIELEGTREDPADRFTRLWGEIRNE